MSGDLQSTRKIEDCLNNQLTLNKLTSAHLRNIGEQTGEAANHIFSQLATISGTLNKISDILLNMSNQRDTITNKNIKITESCEPICKSLHEIIDRAKLNENGQYLMSAETVKDIKSVIDTLVEYNHDLNNVQNELIDRFSESIKGFAGYIMEAISHLQFEDSTRQQLQTILKYLDDNNSYLQCLTNCMKEVQEQCTSVCSIPEFDINEIAKYYVMESQRQTHKSVVGSIYYYEKEDENADSVELF
ncbi:MAG: hypothetical protein L3V56_14245 [Candidatus Magnetoovum sp. WYHC-5]|nr:hypothetical protein [Candidatus Magnetoovum sp. WYHC-5]